MCSFVTLFFSYDYKELLKKAKSSLDEVSKEDIAGIKAAKGRCCSKELLLA